MSKPLNFSPTWHSKRQYDIFYCGARYVIVPGGRRSGKTTGGLTHAAHQGLTRPGIHMLWVDTTQGNIDKYVSEILLPMLPTDSYKWNRQQKVLKFSSGAIMHFGSAERPENLEGFGYNIIYLNEAGIILKGASGERLWHNTLRPMTIQEGFDGSRCQVFFIGTPKGRGLFHEFAKKAESGDPDWRRFRLSTYDNPLIPKEEIDALVRETPGKIALQEIYGEFLEEDEGEPIIPMDWTRSATARQLEEDMDYEVFWGLDVARGGNDRSALCKRRWTTLLEPVMTWQKKNSTELAEEIRDVYLLTKVGLNRPKEILVDEIGFGSGVLDYGRKIGLPMRGINVARKSVYEKKYTQLRDELWWKARAWMPTGSLAGDEKLGRELSLLLIDQETLDKKGLFKAESKDKLKIRLGAVEGRSPDLADSFILTMAAGIERKEDRSESRDYGRQRQREDDYTFMGA